MKKLQFIAGCGYEDYYIIGGTFEIVYGNDESLTRKIFKKLSQAIVFYESLQEEKSLWHYKNGGSELLASHTYN